MSLLGLIVTLVVVGVVLWVVNAYVPMEASIKKLLNVAVIIIVVLYLLQQMGFLGSLSGIRVGRT